jgi:hypothetical protein
MLHFRALTSAIERPYETFTYDAYNNTGYFGHSVATNSSHLFVSSPNMPNPTGIDSSYSYINDLPGRIFVFDVNTREYVTEIIRPTNFGTFLRADPSQGFGYNMQANDNYFVACILQDGTVGFFVYDASTFEMLDYFEYIIDDGIIIPTWGSVNAPVNVTFELLYDKIVVFEPVADSISYNGGAITAYNLDGTLYWSLPSPNTSYQYFGQSTAVHDDKLYVQHNLDSAVDSLFYEYDIQNKTYSLVLTGTGVARPYPYGHSFAVNDDYIIWKSVAKNYVSVFSRSSGTEVQQITYSNNPVAPTTTHFGTPARIINGYLVLWSTCMSLSSTYHAPSAVTIYSLPDFTITSSHYIDDSTMFYKSRNYYERGHTGYGFTYGHSSTELFISHAISPLQYVPPDYDTLPTFMWDAVRPLFRMGKVCHIPFENSGNEVSETNIVTYEPKQGHTEDRRLGRSMFANSTHLIMRDGCNIFVRTAESGAFERYIRDISMAINTTGILGYRDYETGFSAWFDVYGDYVACGAATVGEDGSYENGKAYLYNYKTGAYIGGYSAPTFYGSTAENWWGYASAIGPSYVAWSSPKADSALGDFRGAIKVYEYPSGAVAQTILNPYDATTYPLRKYFGEGLAFDDDDVLYALINESGLVAIDVPTGNILHNFDEEEYTITFGFGYHLSDLNMRLVQRDANKVLVGCYRNSAVEKDAGCIFEYDKTTWTQTARYETPNYNPYLYYPPVYAAYGSVVKSTENYIFVLDKTFQSLNDTYGMITIFDTNMNLVKKILPSFPTTHHSYPDVDIPRFNSGMEVTDTHIYVGNRSCDHSTGTSGSGFIGKLNWINETWDYWVEAVSVYPSSPNEFAADFGKSISVDEANNLLVVGAPMQRSATYTEGAVHVFNATTGAHLHSFANEAVNPATVHYDYYGEYVYAKDGYLIVQAPGQTVLIGSIYEQIWVYNASTYALIYRLGDTTQPNSGYGTNYSYYLPSMTVDNGYLYLGYFKWDHQYRDNLGRVAKIDLSTGLESQSYTVSSGRETYGSDSYIGSGPTIITEDYVITSNGGGTGYTNGIIMFNHDGSVYAEIISPNPAASSSAYWSGTFFLLGDYIYLGSALEEYYDSSTSATYRGQLYRVDITQTPVSGKIPNVELLINDRMFASVGDNYFGYRMCKDSTYLYVACVEGIYVYDLATMSVKGFAKLEIETGLSGAPNLTARVNLKGRVLISVAVDDVYIYAASDEVTVDKCIDNNGGIIYRWKKAKIIDGFTP